MDENGDCEREREGEGGWCWAKVSLIRFCFGASFARISCGNSASTEGSTWLGRTNCVPVMLRGLYLVSDASVRVEERDLGCEWDHSASLLDSGFAQSDQDGPGSCSLSWPALALPKICYSQKAVPVDPSQQRAS